MLLNERRLVERMAELRLDAVIATSAENVTYTSGFWALSQWIRRGPQAYVLWPLDAGIRPAVVTSSSSLDLFADQSPCVADVRPYGEFQLEIDRALIRDPVDQRYFKLKQRPSAADALAALITAIKDKGLSTARIAIEEAGLESGYFNRLKETLPKVTWLSGSELLRFVRSVKTPHEIERLRQVAHIAERSIEAALAVAKEGATEQELAYAFHTETIKSGGMPVLGCIGFGERSALANVQPSQRKLRIGEIIRFDVGGRFSHYRADIARNAVFGRAPPEAKRLHHALLRGVEHACDTIRPGMAACQIFDEVVNVVRKEGIPHYRRDHVGHGIGLDGYDAPSLTGSSRDPIEEGMVLCVETPYYELGRWGLQVEDMIVVRANGAERLMSTTGELIEVLP
ncbi:endopeptidase [Labrys miyagiensis]|uniref:Endopeptidase n=1 Tax=Labrys miyagiensis TaxID=346912 RepID=A0ABQ6CEH0_9HYPH|nr:Xaa-Pro peptidase family protein [Labrys miyagiensis]GLS18053.1 endopeptidase [Labrys miyagiensis]